MSTSIEFARRMRGITPSAVREILKVAERPDVLSFAGGLPAPELFPVEELARAYADVFASEGPAALQYGITEGYGPLREWIAHKLGERGIASAPERLLIVSGSQQGIDLVARVMLNPGDTVLVENPTYLAALQAFSTYEVKLVAVGSDDDGMHTAQLDEVIAQHKPALLYVVPEFQNPKGTSLALDRRKQLIAAAQRGGVPVLEDDPYGALRFRGVAQPPLAALSDDVIHLGTFSKTLAPGLRIGWVHGPREVIRKMIVAKQACDLQTATLAQRAAAKLLETFDYEGHLGKIRRVYGERGLAMLDALERHMPEGVRWTNPDGGLFLWMELPSGVRDDDVFKAAIAQKVAVVPGNGFFVGPAQNGFLRLNFSNQPVEKIELGMARLGDTLQQLLGAGQRPAANV
ncbi:MAG: PLP-dependent aminotransferase family protein [Myxococcaceae bacterium]